MLKILQTLQSPYFLSVLFIVEIQRMHRTDVFNSLRNVKTEPIFNDVKENRKYFMVLKSISIYSQESIHKECPHIFRNFWPPPPVTTVDIWLTSPTPPVSFLPALQHTVHANTKFEYECDSKYPSSPPLPLYEYQENESEGQIFVNKIDTRRK